MNAFLKQPDKGDPSDIQQVFPGVDIQLLCCRYWWLKNWEFNELSFPYWRIYHNDCDGATVIYNRRKYRLEPNKIALIMPNTPFSTRLYHHKIPEYGYLINGGRITKGNYDKMIENKNTVTHQFIHFNLGSIYDNVKPGVFMIKTTPFLSKRIKEISNYLITNYASFNFQVNLIIHSLVTDILTKAPENTWELPTNDTRILKIMNFVEDNPLKDLTNDALAGRIGLATNSFTRLFTNELGLAPQRYVKKVRVNKASILLHHTHKTIDKIAMECGFADRYHFSRVFKQLNNISPAKYRRSFMMR